MKLSKYLTVLFALFVLLSPLLLVAQTNSVPSVGSDGLPQTQADYWKWAIAFVAPLIVGGIWKLVPKLPGWLIPISTIPVGIGLGALLDWVGKSNLTWIDSAQLGGLAVLVRESFDQAVKAWRAKQAAAAAGFGLILLLFMPGMSCRPLDPGADPFVVRTEQTQKVLEGTFDFVLNLDQTDRGYWRTNAPAFHEFCEQLRVRVPVVNVPGKTNLARYIYVQWQVDQAKLTYKAAKSASTSNALFSALISLQGLGDQTTAWMTIITNRPPQPNP